MATIHTLGEPAVQVHEDSIKAVNSTVSEDSTELFTLPEPDYENPYPEGAETKLDFLIEMLKQLKIGTDLWRVALPASILECRSFLEKLTDFNSHPSLLLKVSTCTSPEERFMAILRWFLSGWHRLPQQGVKKPFNPILGEIFRASWKHEDGSETTYFAEQVSHHPPISAFYIENSAHGIVVEGYAQPEAHMRGQTATMALDGEAVVYLTRTNERYRMLYPSLLVRGIIFGSMSVETSGETEVSCPETGYSAKIEFKKQKVTAQVLRNKEEIYTIKGATKGLMVLKSKEKRNKVESDFLDIGALKIHTKTVQPTPEQQHNESRRVWYSVSSRLNAKDVEGANVAKSTIEGQQRGLRNNDEEWTPAHFRRVEGGWKYINSSV